MADASAERTQTIFISYSRDDVEFADQLIAVLGLLHYEVAIDRHRMAAGEEFQARLGGLIRDADAVVFVLSPASAASDMCRWEVEEAARLGKRILPLLARPLDGAAASEILAARDWIHAYAEPKVPGSGWGTGLARLVAALDTDVAWVREHTRLLQRASEWDAAGGPDSRLLFGEAIAEARAWIDGRPKEAPEPTALHHDFIRASEEAAVAQRQRRAPAARHDRRRPGRTSRGPGGQGGGSAA